MVGLVLVSHSRALADALVGLIQQVTSADLPVAVAAGIGEDRSEFGTDAVEIMEAIQSVYSEDGVLVLKRIHVVAHLRAPATQREAAERAFQVFAAKCPMHQSIRKAINITTELDFQPVG